MYSSGLLILLLICLIHPQSISALVDREGITISGPHVVPLDAQPGIRRREVLKALRQRQRTSADSCPSNFDQCGNGLPSEFCCRSTERCIGLADNSSVLCCPDGGTCSSIEPITCSLAVQNATAYPTSSVHSINLDGSLPVCGRDSSGSDTCCPFGYSCNEKSVCVLTQAETPVSTGILATATSGSTPAPTMTDSVGTTTTSPAAESTYTMIMPTHVSDSERDNSSSDRPKTIGIATGSAVGGVAAVAGILVFAWIKRKRIKETAKQKRQSITQRFSETPPPLPPKEFPYPTPTPKKKRRSMIPSWVPSVINKTAPAELPATPVSFSAWNNQWDGVQPPNRAHRPYPRDSMSPPQAHELEARWLPQPGQHEREPMFL